MQQVQEATAFFFAPTTVAYAASLLGWVALDRWGRGYWPPRHDVTSDRPWFDLGLTFAALLGIAGFGLLYDRGYLLPTSGERWGGLAWQIDNLIIYSPIAAVLIYRAQSLETVFLSYEGLLRKVAAGVALGGMAVALFLLVRGEMQRFAEVFGGVFVLENWRNALAVFLEGVALAFGFVRLRWTLGLVPALLLPAILFAAFHLPRSVNSGREFGEMAAFFVFNTAIVVGILYVVQRSQDVIWIGIVHFWMDIAIRAFD